MVDPYHHQRVKESDNRTPGYHSSFVISTFANYHLPSTLNDPFIVSSRVVSLITRNEAPLSSSIRGHVTEQLHARWR